MTCLPDLEASVNLYKEVNCTNSNIYLSVCTYTPHYGYGFVDLRQNSTECLEDAYPNDQYGDWSRFPPDAQSLFISYLV